MNIKDIFRKPTPSEMMARELDDARRSLLEALSSKDHAEASVAYHQARITRLRTMLNEETDEE